MNQVKFSFRPKLLDCLKGYNRSTFTADLCAGFSVGILALPLAMAFGIASGVSPAQGIYTAIIAGFMKFLSRKSFISTLTTSLKFLLPNSSA